MKRTQRAVLTLTTALIVAGPWAHDQVPGKDQTTPVLLQGGDLYTVADGVLKATDLLFEAGEIRKIGKNLRAPDGAQVVDVRGKRVYPGLIAAQTQVGLVEIGSVRATRDTSETGSWTPEVEAHTAYNPDSEVIPTLRSNGVTTVQVIPGGGRLSGRPAILNLDGWNKEDAAVRLTHGMQMNWPSAGINRAWWNRTPEAEQRKRAKEARESMERTFQLAKAYHEARSADPSTAVDLRWEAMRPLFAGEEPLFISANDLRQIHEAVAFSVRHGLKIVLVGGDEAHLAADLLKANAVSVILGAVYALPRHEDSDYDLAYRLPSLLAEAGVDFCISLPSSWSVRNLPLEAGQAAAYGLDVDRALRAITLDPARILGVEDRLGSLEVGKSATLFISGGDVMDMLGHDVQQMWIEGRAVDLDDRHKTLYRKYDER